MYSRIIVCVLVAAMGVGAVTPQAHATPPQVWVNDNAQIGYRVTLWKNGDPAQKIVLQGTVNQIQNGQWVAPGVTLYSTHWTNTSLNLPYMTEEYWAFQAIADAGSGIGVFEVEFPILKLNPFTDFPAKDRLLVPYGPGKAIPNPWSVTPSMQGGRPRQRSGIWYGIYGDTSQSMQLLLYDDGNPDSTSTRGMMLRTADPDSHMKDFHVSKMGSNDIFPSGTVYASVHHYPDNAGQVGASFTGSGAPLYLVATDCYEGGWEQAVRERYRNWAISQNWTARGRIIDRINSGNLPAWYMNNVMWTTVTGQSADLGYLSDDIQPAFPGIEVGVFVTQWQRWPFNVFNPDFYPPKDSATFQSLRNMQTTATDQAAGIHLFPYLNVNLVDEDYNYPEAAGTDPAKVTLFNNLIAGSRIKGPNGIIPNPAGIPSWDSYGNPMPGTMLSDNYFDPTEVWSNHQRFFDSVTGQWSGTGLTEKFRDSLLAVRQKPWSDADVQTLLSPTSSVANTTGPGLYAPEFFGLKYQRDGIYNYLQSKWRTVPDVNGDYITSVEINSSTVISRRRYPVLCRGAAGWHSYFLDKCSTLLKPIEQGGFATDGVYMDQFDSARTSFLCFSATHTLSGQPHPKGFGTYIVAGNRKLAGDIAANNPGKILFAEHASETTVDVIQEHYAAYPLNATDTVVPLFSTVYQGYTSFHEWYIPDDVVTSSNRADFTDALAQCVHVGYKLGGISSWQSYFDVYDDNAVAAQQYSSKTASMLRQNLIDLLTYGQRMSDPQFIGAVTTQSITRYGFNANSAVVEVPVIRGSCWRSYGTPARKLLLLSNTSSQPVIATIKSPLFSDNDLLTDKALDAGGQPTQDVFTYSQQAGVTVTIPPQGWRALVH